MFSVGEDVEADALSKRGWTISAIARHLGRDRKTVRSYLSGERTPGVRRPAVPDPLGRVPRPMSLPASPTTRTCGPRPCSTRSSAARLRRLVCELRPPDPPGRAAPALRGLLGGEGPRDHRDRPPRRRGDPVGLVRAAQGPLGGDRLCAARHAVALGPHPGGARRVDGPGPSHRGHGRRDAPPGRHRPHVAHRPPGHGDRARHAPMCRPASPRWPSTTGPSSTPCPPRRGNRKGAVECGVKFCCGRWWRTMTATTPAEAQVSLDRFWSTTGDARLRPPGRYVDPGDLTEEEGRRTWPTVGELADAEVLMALPAVPYPATIEVRQRRRRQGQRGLPGQPLLGAPGDGRGRAHAAPPARHRQPRGLLAVGHRARLPPPGPHRAPGQMVRTPSTGPLSRRWCSASSPPLVPVTARPTSHPARPPWPSGPACSRTRRAEPSVDLEAMAEIIALAFPGATQAGEVPA